MLGIPPLISLLTLLSAAAVNDKLCVHHFSCVSSSKLASSLISTNSRNSSRDIVISSAFSSSAVALGTVLAAVFSPHPGTASVGQPTRRTAPTADSSRTGGSEAAAEKEQRALRARGSSWLADHAAPVAPTYSTGTPCGECGLPGPHTAAGLAALSLCNKAATPVSARAS